jgi:hypothetical protein
MCFLNDHIGMKTNLLLGETQESPYNFLLPIRHLVFVNSMELFQKYQEVRLST